jgi:hypothetical protein
LPPFDAWLLGSVSASLISFSNIPDPPKALPPFEEELPKRPMVPIYRKGKQVGSRNMTGDEEEEWIKGLSQK